MVEPPNELLNHSFSRENAHLTAPPSTLRRIISGTSVYSIAIIAGRLNSILLLPIYTRYLSATEYGTL